MMAQKKNDDGRSLWARRWDTPWPFIFLVLLLMGLAIWRVTTGLTLGSSPAPSSSARALNEEAVTIRKNAAIERCEQEGGTAVMGYGWKVVCVKPIWTDDPKWPPLRDP